MSQEPAPAEVKRPARKKPDAEAAAGKRTRSNKPRARNAASKKTIEERRARNEKAAERAARRLTRKAWLLGKIRSLSKWLSQPFHKQVNILFVGGSNTVMRNGYRQQAIQRLSQHLKLNKVDNLAIGGTTMGMGLWQVLRQENLRSYDIIFVEYCVNDITYAESPERLIYWRWIYDSFLRRIRSVNQRARIYPLMFGRRGYRNDTMQNAVFDGVRDISPKYDARPLPIDEFLHGLLDKPDLDDQLYVNGAHYLYPDITMRVAEYIEATVIAEKTAPGGSRRLAPPARPPDVLYRDHALFAGLGASKVFRNSRYNITAIALEVGGPWQEIEVPGELVQINYITTQNAARLMVWEDGRGVVAFDTRHSETDIFPFLIRDQTFHWKSPPESSGKAGKLKLRAVSTDAVEEEFTYISEHQVLAPEDAATHNVVYLFGALFS